MARKLTWETAFWSETTAVADSVLTVTYGGINYVELISVAEVEDSDRDRIWVERVVGHTFCAGISAAGDPGNTFFKERISVGRRFSPGVLSQSDVSQPFSPAQSIDNFLWERPNRTRFSGSNIAGAQGPELLTPLDQPYWSTVDVRVGRLLKPTDFLAYTIQADGALFNEGAFIYMWGWMRVLISRL